MNKREEMQVVLTLSVCSGDIFSVFAGGVALPALGRTFRFPTNLPRLANPFLLVRSAEKRFTMRPPSELRVDGAMARKSLTIDVTIG